MQRNKIFSRLLSLLLMAAAATTFTACGSDDDDNDSTAKQYDDLEYFQKALCDLDANGNLVGYKVGTVLQQKDETKGKIVKPGEDKEILVDDLGAFFLVSTEEASGQLSMFNTWDEFEDEVTGDDAEDEEENDDE